MRLVHLNLQNRKVKTMKTVSKLLGAASLLAMSAGASAITVGHITWNPAYPLDFSSVNSTIYQNINPTSSPVGEVSGYGLINVINGSGSFADAGFQLTYHYQLFDPFIAGTLPTAPGEVIEYTGGTVQFFVHATTILDTLDPLALTFDNTDLNNGSVWLTLAGHGVGPRNTTLVGTVNSDGSGGFGTLTGGGQLDVINGLAMAYFDSNKKSGGSDFTFGSTFTSYLPNNALPSATDIQNAYGSAVFAGATVPEPGSIALLGLGLLGFGVMRRKTA
jgi:hypothetical protein